MIVKLVSGEEVLGEVISSDDNSVVLKNTVAIAIQPTEKGMQVGFLPWGNYVEGNKTLALDKVIYKGMPNDEMKNNYNSIFGGILTAPKQLIV